MLEINGIPPRLTNQLCERLICQEYWYKGKQVQQVDVLYISVNGHWHQLYFEEGIVFWRTQLHEPIPVGQQEGSPFDYPLVDLGQKYALEDSMITDCETEALVDGARVSLEFEGRGTLLVTHNEGKTRLQFNAL